MNIDDLISLNIPDVLEKIFIEHLDYVSFRRCLDVSDLWRNKIEEYFFNRKKFADILREKQLVHCWFQCPVESQDLDLESVLELYPAGHRISFIDAGSNDTLVVCTRHGQRRGLLARFNLNGECITHQPLELDGSLNNVLATRRTVFIFAHNSDPMAFERDTLENIPNLNLLGAKKFQLTPSGTIFSLMRRSGSKNDFVLRKVDPGDHFLRTYREFTLERVSCHCSGIQDAHSFSRQANDLRRVTVVSDDHVMVVCKHGTVQLVDHKRGCVLWTNRHLKFECSRIQQVLLGKTFSAISFVNQLENVHEYIVHLVSNKTGKLLCQPLIFNCLLKPSMAISDDRFVFAHKEMDKNSLFMDHDRILVHSCKISSGCRKSVFKVDSSSMYQKLKILSNRILIIQCFIGPPMAVGGEVIAIDLEDPLRQKRFNDFRYCGPLHQELIGFNDDFHFVFQSVRDRKQNIKLSGFHTDPSL